MKCLTCTLYKPEICEFHIFKNIQWREKMKKAVYP